MESVCPVLGVSILGTGLIFPVVVTGLLSQMLLLGFRISQMCRLSESIRISPDIVA